MKIKRTIIALLCLGIICTLAACNSTKPDESNFTISDLERGVTLDAVMSRYSSYRQVSTYYINSEDGDVTEIEQTTIGFKKDGRVIIYTDTGFGESYVIEDGNLYAYSNGMYGVAAFIDDGYFEQSVYYLQTKWVTYTPTEGEEIVSVSDSDGIRTVITNLDSVNFMNYEEWGLPHGQITLTYRLDLENGYILETEGYVTVDGEKKMLVSSKVVYGEDDAFELPEFVALCKDMTETRTVTYIFEPGVTKQGTYTFTFPKSAFLMGLFMGEYEYFNDPEFTDPHTRDYDEPPAELTVYLKRVD